METITLSPDVLSWAASQVGSTLDEIARKISKRHFSKIAGGLLTSAEAVKFSEKTQTPLGYLFLHSPPAPRELPIADFRTLPASDRLSKDFFDVFDDIDYKQSWYRDYLLSVGAEPLAFVGKFAKEPPAAKVVADDMRNILEYDVSEGAGLGSSDELFSLLVSKCEKAGILVFKNGVVGNNTRRRLAVSEFRGFAISDSIAPVVFINGTDAPAAWLFTLAHELAHIWLGESGVSDAAWKTQNSHERFCNAIAAEFFVPKADFAREWNKAADLDPMGKIESFRRHFKVSTLVLARTALELGLVGQSFYSSIYTAARGKAKNEKSGGNFYATLGTRNSKTLSRRVADLAVSGGISLRLAGRLLNTNPNNVLTFHAKQ